MEYTSLAITAGKTRHHLQWFCSHILNVMSSLCQIVQNAFNMQEERLSFIHDSYPVGMDTAELKLTLSLALLHFKPSTL